MRILQCIFMTAFLGCWLFMISCEGHFNNPTYFSEYEDWEVTNFGRGRDCECKALAIGALREDGIVRVYLIQDYVSSKYVLEYSYEEGKWQEKVICTHASDSYIMEGSMIIGQGRNDGIDRIYIARGLGERNLIELSYSDGNWDILNIDNNTYLSAGLTMGSARNDGIQRIYCIHNNGGILEYTYANNQWEKTELTIAGEYFMHGISIGKARNDGIQRIYAACSNGHICEFSYSGSENWDMSDLGSVRSSEYGNIINIALGQGRSDGLERVYAGVQYHSTIHEFTYCNEGLWEKDSTDARLGSGCEGLFIGAGRNDGFFRVYLAGNFHELDEFSYLNSTWNHTAELRGGPSFVKVTVGPGRGDDVNRIYGMCNDGYTYEFSYTP